MIKTFLIGAVPLSLFMYFGVFHTIVFFTMIIVLGLVFAAYCIGDAIREEFFGDKNEN